MPRSLQPVVRREAPPRRHFKGSAPVRGVAEPAALEPSSEVVAAAGRGGGALRLSDRGWGAAPLLLCALLCAAGASAQEDAAPPAPQMFTAPSTAAPAPEALERPSLAADGDAAPLPSLHQRLARKLDSVLAEAGRDLSLTINLLAPTTWASAGTDATALEARLLEAKGEGWAIAPQLERRQERLTLRLLAVPPGSSLIRVIRVELEPRRLELQAISALRAITSPQDQAGQPETTAPSVTQLSPTSEGRAVLAVSGALAGGYFGFSLEHIGGSGDPRLVYPLMTLGAAVGVGASLVISEEWDIAPAEAWYTLAAITWPTAAGILIAQRVADDPDDQFLYGAVGTFAGLTLGAVGVNMGEIEPAGALLTHSSGFFGAIFGALVERLVEPTQSQSPSLGMGVGMAAGSLLGGWGATLLQEVPSSRIVYIDLATVLGMLAGAAAASPAIVGQDNDDTENRIWFSATTAGGLFGATLGVLLTQRPAQSGDAQGSAASPTRAASGLSEVSPMIIPLHFSDATSPQPVFGLRGRW